MEQILENIQSELSGITELKYIAPNWGQLDEVNPPLIFPCAIIDIEEIDYTEKARGTQTATAILSVTIADRPSQNTSYQAPAQLKTQFYRIFDLISSASKTLYAYTSPLHSKLVRMSLKRQLRDDNIKEYTLFFKLAYNENLSEPMQYVPVKPVIDIKTVGS